MYILALDGSGLVAGVSLLTEDKILAEYTVNYKKTHSQTLLPMLDEVMKMLEMEVGDVDYIAVTNGPGSFTGLRICASTAKGLGLALNKPIVAVPTVDALAYNYEGVDKIICPLMDARRSQVYTGIYTFEKPEGSNNFDAERKFAVVSPQEAVSIEEIIKKINELGREVVFLGDGVPVNRKHIEELVKVPYTLAPPQLAMQSGAAVGRCALRMISEGKVTSAMELVPDYLRLSQAERERMEK
ncbi:MAG: tRNA (adenosine(37)-N6)-threonylcarbamoyltransferase complex dimerization subunit type 1 TsaB [Lachnospiraceae bacterium]